MDVYTKTGMEIAAFKESIGENDFGFIDGFKGKQLLISSDNDVENMYRDYKGKPCVRIWLKCIQHNPRKRNRSDSEGSTSKAKRSAGPGYDSKMDEVEKFEELHDKHSPQSKYEPGRT